MNEGSSRYLSALACYFESVGIDGPKNLSVGLKNLILKKTSVLKTLVEKSLNIGPESVGFEDVSV